MDDAVIPVRVQLRRTKGWRLPPGVVIVDRRTLYGNPWTPRDAAAYSVPRERWREWAVAQYAREMRERGGTGEIEFVTIEQIRERLGGRHLACWCPLTDGNGTRVPCHADVLLRVANGGQP